jgi:hypothetical protein
MTTYPGLLRRIVSELLPYRLDQIRNEATAVNMSVGEFIASRVRYLKRTAANRMLDQVRFERGR